MAKLSPSADPKHPLLRRHSSSESPPRGSPGGRVVRAKAPPVLDAGVAAVTGCWLVLQCLISWTFYQYAQGERPDEHEISCAYGSAKYFALCGFGGIISCGLTHTGITPLDLVKCRIQVDKAKYRNLVHGFRVTYRETGTRGLVRGWAPTCIGYSLQGLGKFGFYEIFKVLYSDMLGEELSYTWRTSLYLAASASAEFLADIMLCPMEASKVRMQTSSTAPTILRKCAPMIYRTEGFMGFYKSLPTLWARAFDRVWDCPLVVTFVAGYIAGVFCAIVSHPADTVVSVMNKDREAGVVKIVKRLGWMGLWGGLFPRIIMIGTLTAAQWFIYDTVKVVFALPRPPPPEMPHSLRLKLEAQGKLPK